MRLTDLDPVWLIYEGRRVGFAFRCPLGGNKRRMWQTCFVEQFPAMGDWRMVGNRHRSGPATQAGIVDASAPQTEQQYQLCKEGCAWTIAGGIESASFETLTVTPSLDGSAGGLWHGFITNGEIVGGLPA